MKEKKIVYRVEDDMDRNDILCTTYQMRNFYMQMRDGFFSNLDVMNYIQHDAVARMAKKGDAVLDVCCGRSLILPLLRWYSKDIDSYTGVDISATNIKEAIRGASRKITEEELKAGYYPFKVGWSKCNVAEMSKHIPSNHYDLVVYTSAIEHMHKEMGAASLVECYKVMKNGAKMFLSSPNTPGNGFNTQYRAHVYEWGYDELKQELHKTGFQIEKEVGLVMKVKKMKEVYENVNPEIRAYFNSLASYLPTAWLTPIAAIPYPKEADEVLFIVRK